MIRAAKTSASRMAARYLRNMEAGKFFYGQADACMDELEKTLKPGDIVIVKGDEYLFNDKGSRFNVGMNARRFELKKRKPEKQS